METRERSLSREAGIPQVLAGLKRQLEEQAHLAQRPVFPDRLEPADIERSTIPIFGGATLGIGG